MWQLLRNYFRTFKSELLQVFGLGILIIIMITGFLANQFAVSYVKRHFFDDICHQTAHQDTYFLRYAPFRIPEVGWNQSWLENADYQAWNPQTKVVTFDKNKFQNATFQIRHDPKYYDASTYQYVYRFYFSYDQGDDLTKRLHIGDQLAKQTGHFYVQFKLAVPANLMNKNGYLQRIAAQIEPFVYQPNHTSFNNNQVNFLITTQGVLDYYNSDSFQKNHAGLRKYSSSDLSGLAVLYQSLICNMLYSEDQLFWDRVYLFHDLFITNHKVAFVQYTPNCQVNVPVIIDDGGHPLTSAPLKLNELLITPLFAKNNHLNVGSFYRFNGDKYRIRGLATSPVAANLGFYFGGIFDNKHQTAAFANLETMNNIANKSNVKVMADNFLGIYPEKSKNLLPNQQINNYWVYQFLHHKFFLECKNHPQYAKRVNLHNAINNMIDQTALTNILDWYKQKTQLFEWDSFGTIATISQLFSTLALSFIILIFIVTILMILVTIYKIINYQKRLIAILKAAGYYSWELGLPLVLSLLIILLVFSMIGVCFAIIAGHFIITTYQPMILLINYGWSFQPLVTCWFLLTTFTALFLIVFVFTLILMKTPVLKMLNQDQTRGILSSFFQSLLKLSIFSLLNRISYWNKLAFIVTSRTYGKTLLVIMISILSSLLMLVSISANNLVYEMINLPFSAINYQYRVEYEPIQQLSCQMINKNNHLIITPQSSNTIKQKPSLYWPIRQAITQILDHRKKQVDQSVIVDFREGYITGSELLALKEKVILPNFELIKILMPDFAKFWINNEVYLDYLTNQNGQNETDLLITFGLLPYNEQDENLVTNLQPEVTLNLPVAVAAQILHYNSANQELVGDCSKYTIRNKTIYGNNSGTNQFLNPQFHHTDFVHFANLTNAKIVNATNWYDENFLKLRQQLITAWGIKNPQTAPIQFIPIITSKYGSYYEPDSQLNSVGRLLYLPYRGFDKENKLIIGIIYDNADNLTSDTAVAPNEWINSILFGSYYPNFISGYANTKFSNEQVSEFNHYFPIFNSDNQYLVDFNQFNHFANLKASNWKIAINQLFDTNTAKILVKTTQDMLQWIIILFTVFAIILALLIMIIISNVIINDNWLLIKIFNQLGMSQMQIAYLFLIFNLPMLIIAAIFGLYLAPYFLVIIANSLSAFSKQLVPVPFQWWYYGLTLFMIISIYLFSYFITWKINQRKQT